MFRRAFVIIVLLAVIAMVAVPLNAQAQQSGKVWRIGALFSGSSKSHGQYVNAFRQGMRELGYQEGKNYVLVSRWGMGKPKSLPGLAKELVKAKVDVILLNGRRTLLAAQEATGDIPIVLGALRAGVRLAKNVTGSTFADRPQIEGLFDHLKKTLPGVKRVAYLSSASKRVRRTLKATQSVAEKRAIEVQHVPVDSEGEIEPAIASATKAGVGALVVEVTAITNFHRTRLLALANGSKLPTLCKAASFVGAGCLMAFTPDRNKMARRAAGFVDKLFKGAKPADLAIDRSPPMRLSINLKTAKRLGITVPPAVVRSADDVIK